MPRRLAAREWVPESIRAMLEGPWTRALVEAHLGHGEGSGPWRTRLAVAVEERGDGGLIAVTGAGQQIVFGRVSLPRGVVVDQDDRRGSVADSRTKDLTGMDD